MNGKGKHVIGAILLGIIVVLCVARLVQFPPSYPVRYLLTSALCVLGAVQGDRADYLGDGLTCRSK